MTWRRALDNAGLALALAVLVSPALLFFLWMLSLSLKYEIDNTAYPPVFIPSRIAWENSLFVTGLSTLAAILIGVPAGYGIARMKAVKASIVVLISRMTPGLSYLIPLFLLFQFLGLMGTLWPQVITHLVITVPIVIWVMIGFFEATPMELLTVFAQRQIIAGLTAGAVK